MHKPLPVPFFSGRHPFVFRPKTSNRRKTTKTTRICIGKAAGGAGKPADSLFCTVVDTDSPYRPFFPAGQETPSPVLSDRLGHNIFQQERDHAHIHDAILIRPRLAVAVQHDDLAEEVAGVSQREGFLCLLFRRVYV